MSVIHLYGDDHISLLEKSNRSYITGEYGLAFNQLNEYLDSTGYSSISDKAYTLGEQIYFFYIRAEVKRGDDEKIQRLNEYLIRYPNLKSDRLENVLSKLTIKTLPPSKDKSAINNESGSNLKELNLDSQYSKEELEIMLRSALLEGQKSNEALSVVTVLLIIFLILALIALIIIIVSVVFLKRRFGRSKTADISPLLLGSYQSVKDDLEELIKECRSYGDKIDHITERKNNSQNIADIVFKISREKGLSQKECLLNYCGALIYDIGLLSVDKSILTSDSVTEEEYEIIKRHVDIGTQLISFIPREHKKLFLDAISKHHENIDGTGYPLGLKKNEIPFLPRVIRVVESYISLISKREYKIICDKEAALLHLSREVKKYDQDIVDLLKKVV